MATSAPLRLSSTTPGAHKVAIALYALGGVLLAAGTPVALAVITEVGAVILLSTALTAKTARQAGRGKRTARFIATVVR